MWRRPVLAALLAGALVTTLGVTGFVSGSGVGTETVFVPVAPCRLVDTRPTTNVGPRTSPLPADRDVVFGAHEGSDDDSTCAIPSTATAINTNVTAIRPTAPSFLTLFPADAARRPDTSNLNYLPGAAPTPNAVTIPLASNGSFAAYNLAGTVDVIVDVNGYYQPSTNVGAPGPKGDPGPAGPANRITDRQIGRLAWYEDPGAAATIATGTGPAGMATDGTNVYVADSGANTVSVIDPAAGTPIDTITVGSGPDSIAFDGSVLYVTNRGSDTVSVIDPATRTVVATVPVGGDPRGVAVAGDRVYVGNSDPSSVSVIDRATRAIVATVPVPTGPTGIAYDGVNVYVTSFDFEAGRPVTIIDAAANSVVDFVTVGNSPFGAAFDGTHVFVTNQADDSVSVVDPTTRTVIDTVDVGAAPRGVAYDGTNIYVANSGDDTVSVVNPATFAVIDTLPVGTGPDGVLFDGTNVFVSNSSGNTISKIVPR